MQLRAALVFVRSRVLSRRSINNGGYELYEEQFVADRFMLCILGSFSAQKLQLLYVRIL